MGLYIGNKQVDMFSLLHGNRGVIAVKDLPTQLTDRDIGRSFVIIPGGSGSAVVGHIYQLVLEDAQLKYIDLNENGGGISAFYDINTKELIV